MAAACAEFFGNRYKRCCGDPRAPEAAKTGAWFVGAVVAPPWNGLRNVGRRLASPLGEERTA
jgi:hypothetical protein